MLFNDYAKQVISTMDIDLIAISSCTDSYYAFDTTYMEEIKQKNRALIQCNLCSNCFVAKRKK
ncbi:MAG: hypothetical protein L6U99_05960 [Clostridium sp.]|nr:MAG: hypothetical protein L6U99_05960 [Clostridium sp.]